MSVHSSWETTLPFHYYRFLNVRCRKTTSVFHFQTHILIYKPLKARDGLSNVEGIALTCAACAGGPLWGPGRHDVSVQGTLRRRQHGTVTQSGGGGRQALAAQGGPGVVGHGVGVRHWHSHMHGEVLRGQGRRLEERHTHIRLYAGGIEDSRSNLACLYFIQISQYQN